ncbi:GNAT family N-acetyltransferase [Oxalicibacterium faecigallinarum]|uniref:N-acetyltransferase domain-containing protein n=1 Tax=Oxalicibacterium faecigallinarum TaxID=573741 RepID=A0A8J3ARS5_9BURK|nr:GNAT family N-acetyltransferase [Oxalicibacterium faecigallinarum]GGI19788.1 hypothetical protein GCM10008066_20780 [Oxalicibacterium faecigallinarum]
MTTLAIRPAHSTDIDRIMELERHGFPAPIRESRAVMQHRQEHFPAGFLVLESDAGEVIGYFCSELWDRDAGIDANNFAVGHDIRDVHRADGNRLYVSSMTIDPHHRGNGMGRQFFTQCLAHVRCAMPQIRHSTLMLSAEWTGAHRIYRQAGYAEAIRLPNFFSSIAHHDADAIVMHRDFA